MELLTKTEHLQAIEILGIVHTLLFDVYILTEPFKNSGPGVIAHTFNSITLEAEAVIPKLAWPT